MFVPRILRGKDQYFSKDLATKTNGESFWMLNFFLLNHLCLFSQWFCLASGRPFGGGWVWLSGSSTEYRLEILASQTSNQAPETQQHTTNQQTSNQQIVSRHILYGTYFFSARQDRGQWWASKNLWVEEITSRFHSNEIPLNEELLKAWNVTLDVFIFSYSIYERYPKGPCFECSLRWPLVCIHELWQKKCNPSCYIYIHTYFCQRFRDFTEFVYVQQDHQEDSQFRPPESPPCPLSPCSRFQRLLVSIVFSGAAACDICWQIFIQYQQYTASILNRYSPLKVQIGSKL